MSEVKFQLVPEVVNDTEKTLNLFMTTPRKNQLLSQYMQEYLKQKIPLERVVAFYRQLQQSEQHFTLLLDSLYVFSLQNEFRKNLIQLLQHLAEKLTQQQKQMFFDYFDEEVLFECGFAEQKQFLSRKRIVNTEINFVQNKFGLMRDENEGYSKLIVEIMEAADSQDIQLRIDNIISLIGYFDLDPDRVVDLILQCWIDQPQSLQYIQILKNFKQVSISQFLGKRFEGLLKNQYSTVSVIQPNDPKIPSHNLILVTAYGLKHGLFKVENIWNYLQPSDEQMAKAQEDIHDESYKFYKSFDQVIQIEDLKEQSSNQVEKTKKDLYEKQKREIFTQHLCNILYIQDNQKLWVLYSLLQQNSYGLFMYIYKIYEPIIDLTNFIPLKRTLAEIIEWMIDPLFQKTFNHIFKSRQRTIPQFNSSYDQDSLQQYSEISNEFLDKLQELLGIFGSYLGEYPTLFHKIVKILSPVQNQRVNEIFLYQLLPAIQNGEQLPVVVEIWKRISQFDFRIRYAAYSKWKDSSIAPNINQIVRTAELTKVHLRNVFNFIDKDNKDRMMLKFAKLTHNQPLASMNQVRRNRLDFADNNGILVHAFGLITYLSLDILVFTIVQWLSDFTEESKTKNKDIECTLWFKNIALFIACVFRKYFTVDMQGLFAYLCEVFASKQSIIKPDLIILREFIEKMTGIVHIEDLTPNQIQALAGGRYIQLETTAQTHEFRKSRKSSQALETFFWNTTIKSQVILNQDNQKEEVSLAFLLLVILCQQRSQFLLKFDNDNLKALSTLYDNFTWSVNQLTKCLLFQSDNPLHYAKLFPENPLHRMVIDFKIQFETAFHIVRYGHKSLYNMTDEEFKKERDNIKKIYDSIEPDLMYQNPGYHDATLSQKIPIHYHTYIKENLWNIINPDLFAIFWLLSLDNIYVPVQVYESQIKSLQDQMLDKQQDAKDRQIKYNQKAFEKLQNELENNGKRKDQFDKFLQEKKDCFVFKDTTDREYHIKFSMMISQVCILPRILIDPSEAIYCAKFIQMILKVGKHKHSNSFYVTKEILYHILTFLQCASEQEATNISIFTQQMLLPFANWNDEAKFKQEFIQYFGTKTEIYEKERSYIINSIFTKIQQLIKCLRANETQVRNALIFLKRIQDVFPPTQYIAEQVKIYLQEVDQEFGNIQDIKTQIRNYHIDEKISKLPNFQLKQTGTTNGTQEQKRQDTQEEKQEKQENQPKEKSESEQKQQHNHVKQIQNIINQKEVRKNESTFEDQKVKKVKKNSHEKDNKDNKGQKRKN